MNNSLISIVSVEPKTAISLRDKCKASVLSAKYNELFTELGYQMQSQKLQAESHPFSICYQYSPEAVDIEAGIPVSGSPVSDGKVKIIQTYGGKAVMMKHFGPYENLHASWNELENYIRENNFQISGYPFEVYAIDERQESDSAKWLTEIYFPVK